MVSGTFNLATALVDAHVAEGRGERAAIRYEGRTLTYAEVARQVDRVGNALRSLGLEREERVALLLPDSPEFVATFLGAMKIGAVPVTLSTHLAKDDYAHLLGDSRSRAAVVHESVWPKIGPLRRDLRHLRHVIVVPQGGGAAAPPGTLSYGELAAAQPDRLDPAPTSPDDMCFWQYSSGTTGRPKAVVHLHGRAMWPADLHGTLVAGITAEDRVFSVPKLFFSYGLNNSLVIPFRHGATSVLLGGRPEPGTVFETIARERPTVFYSVPTSYAALLAAPGTPDLSSLRLCISAGEALPAPIYERWRARFGLEILDGLGSTEIGYICISNFPGRARPGTSGQVIPGYDAVVQGEAGSPAPPGEPGDLLVRGPSTAVSYWGQSDRTKHAFRGAWVFTGDRYAVDADGYYTYLGRSDDLLRVSGMWMSPIEVESVLLCHPAVLECAVVGRADADGLVRPCAYVVPAAGRSGDAVTLAAELATLADERLAPYKRPRWVEFVSELPRTSTGKIQRFKLRA